MTLATTAHGFFVRYRAADGQTRVWKRVLKAPISLDAARKVIHRMWRNTTVYNVKIYTRPELTHYV